MKFDIPEYLKSRGLTFKRTGKEAITDCVWCNKPAHLYINTRTGNYVCFRCGEHGRKLLGLICYLENCDYKEAARFIKHNEPTPRRNLSLLELKDKVTELRKKSVDGQQITVDLPKEFVPVFHEGQWRYPTYLKKRGISRETARDFNVGFCETGRYANRIVLPFECPNGSGFTARDLTGYAKQKYLNVSGVNRKLLLYGWREDQFGADLVLCEGPFDVLKLHEHGVPALGLLGKTLTQGQFALLTAHPPDTVITVMLDPEAELEPLQIVRALYARFSEVYIAKLPAGTDPGDSTADQVWKALNKAEKVGNPRLAVSARKLFHVKRKAELGIV